MNKYSSKSTLFLMETVIAILFFAIASAVCTQIFVKAHLVSKSASKENFAYVQINSFAATVKAENGDAEKTSLLYKTKAQGNTITLYFDNAYCQTNLENGKYILAATWLNDEKIEIKVVENETQTVIATQQIGYHRPLLKGGQ